MRIALTYALAGAGAAFAASKVFGNPTTLVGLQVTRVLVYALVAVALMPLVGGSQEEQHGHPASRLAVPLAFLFLFASVVVIYEPLINYTYQLHLPPRSWQLSFLFQPYVLFYGAVLGAAMRFAMVVGDLQGPRVRRIYQCFLIGFTLIGIGCCVYLTGDVVLAGRLWGPCEQ
jgi:hypothetical protein